MLGRARTLRGDERGAGYVGGYATWVAREQWPIRHGRVRANQEIGEDGLARSSRSSVVGVGVPGEECRRRWDLLDDRHRGERRVQCLDAREPWGDLGKDDGVEDDRAALGRLRELLL